MEATWYELPVHEVLTFPLETANKRELYAQLELAASRTMVMHPQFRGVFLYGGFTHDRPFNDIDVLPIFDMTVVPMQPPTADVTTVHRANEFFREHFPKLPTPIKRRDGGELNRLIHMGHGSVILDNRNQTSLLVLLLRLQVDPENFVGDQNVKDLTRSLLERM